MSLRTTDRADAPERSGVVSVPGDQLDSLRRRVSLNGAEWRITPRPPVEANPPRSVVKRIVRGLVAWRILERTPDGLQVQPDAARWKPPGTARPDLSRRLQPASSQVRASGIDDDTLLIFRQRLSPGRPALPVEWFVSRIVERGSRASSAAANGHEREDSAELTDMMDWPRGRRTARRAAGQ
jgi:hypothetical protein